LDVRIEALNQSIVKMTTNDLPHIEVQMRLIQDNTAKTNVMVAEKFATLFTIIDERIPRK
jgi:hypothetical protein